MVEAATEHPDGATNWFDEFVADSQAWLRRILVEDGYQPVRYFNDMVRSDFTNIPNVELPQGIETRPVTPDQLHEIWRSEGEAFAEHWGEAVLDESDYESWVKNPIWKTELWQVAWHGDKIVGSVLNYVDENENKRYGYKRGYTENISVQKAWRGQGIAKALLVKSIKMFRDMGFDHTALGVDSENETGALHLYEGVGYQVVRTVTMYRRRMVDGR